MKVAIVGSGPAGLASARFLAQAGIIPKIFDSSDCVGGLWKQTTTIQMDVASSKCWKSLHTNLSKYTCSFSDFPWHADTPMFPSFHDMHKYLKAYADCYLKPEYFSFYSTVIKTSRKSGGGYLVEWMDEKTKECHSEEFNAVVVASGFHNDSVIHSAPGERGLTSDYPTSIPYIHSTAYRSPERYFNKRVVVVGSSYSATEISAEISQYTKSVHNIQSRYVYIVPRFIPTEPMHPASPRLPLDMVFYTMNPADIDAEVWSEDGSVLLSQPKERMVRTDEDKAARIAYFNKLIYGVDSGSIGTSGGGGGGNGGVVELVSSHSEGSPRATLQAAIRDSDVFPYVSISDTFNNQQLAKKIEVVYGRYVGSEGSTVRVSRSISPPDPSATATTATASTGETVASPVIDSMEEIEINDVDEIIFCTGMRPKLDYLDSSILQTLQYDKEDLFLPVVLYKETLHPDVPNLFFVGCHKGPYFAIIELQAVSDNDINHCVLLLLTQSYHYCIS